MTADAQREYLKNPLCPNNCAIIEQTGDGVRCGRCYFFVGNDDKCPRHGNVKVVMEKFRATGELTLEQDFDRTV
jgi:hypothetical protein